MPGEQMVGTFFHTRPNTTADSIWPEIKLVNRLFCISKSLKNLDDATDRLDVLLDIGKNHVSHKTNFWLEEVLTL